MDLRKHFRLALAYLFIISLLGVVLRHFQISDIPINYKFTLHAHSHVALLGWVYTALTTLIYSMYLSNASISKDYRVLFWFTQVTIIGMMITFSISGYSIVSILFSTLFLFASYRFTYLFLKNTTAEQKRSTSYKWIRAALWFMVLSSLGPWVLGVVMNTLGSDSVWYRNAIYFYLHFQYNGWFIMALVGMLLKLLEDKQIISPGIFNPHTFWLFFSGVLLTFFLSVLWMKPHITFYILSGLGALFQIIAFVYILKDLLNLKLKIRMGISKMTGLLLKTAGVLFLFKLIAQTLGALPDLAQIVSVNKDLIIGYLHWIFLGVVSISIFAFSSHKGFLRITKPSLFFFLIGFLLTEVLLLYKSYVVWSNSSLNSSYYTILFIVSFIFFISIGIILFQQRRTKNDYN